MIVKPIGDVATITCLYKPMPDRRISWSVIKFGYSSVIESGSAPRNIKVSNDTKTLIFDPIIQSDGGNYFCWAPVTQLDDIFSKVVPLIILCESIVNFYAIAFYM